MKGWQKKGILAALVVGAGMLPAAPARAEGEMGAVIALKMEKSRLDSEGKKLDKETSDLAATHERVGAEVQEVVKSKAALDAKQAEVKAEDHAVAREVDQYNMQCGGEVDPGTYQRCMAWRAELEPKRAAVVAKVDEVNKEIEKHEARRQSVLADVNELEAREARHNAAMARLEKRMHAWKQRFDAVCSGTEDIQQCLNRLFDGNRSADPCKGLPLPQEKACLDSLKKRR